MQIKSSRSSNNFEQLSYHDKLVPLYNKINLREGITHLLSNFKHKIESNLKQLSIIVLKI